MHTGISAALALSLAAAALTPAEAKTAQQTRIVFVTHGQASDSYWSVVKKGMADAAKAMGSKVEYFAPEVWDVVKMQKMLDAAVASKPDGLVVSVPDGKALGPSLKKAIAAGIPVIVVDTSEEEAKAIGAQSFIGGASQYEAGKAAGEKMKAAGVADAICVNHEVGNGSLDTRCRGFKDGLGGKMEVVAVTMDPTETANRVTAFLSSHPGVQGVLTLGPAPAVPVMAALKKSDRLRTVKFGTFDLSPEVLDAVGKGEMLFGIDFQQYLMGYLPVVNLTLNATTGTMPTSNVYTGPAFVMKKDVPMLMELAKKGIR